MDALISGLHHSTGRGGTGLPSAMALHTTAPRQVSR